MLGAVAFWVFAMCDCDCSWCATVALLDCGLEFLFGRIDCDCSQLLSFLCIPFGGVFLFWWLVFIVAALVFVAGFVGFC